MRKEPRLHGNANKVVVIFLLLFAVFFIGGAWFLTEQGPGSAGRSSRKSGKASSDLPMKVSALISSTPRIEEWKLSEELILEASQVTDLRSIIVKVEEVQMEKNHLSTSDMVRIDELGELAEKLLSSHLRNESLRKEAEAHILLASQQEAQALVLLERAFALQTEINESFPQSAAVDRTRIFILEREIREQQAEPLYQKSFNQEKAGEEALSSGRIKEAQAYFQAAFVSQAEINEQYPNSRRRDPLRPQELQARSALAEAHELVKQQEVLLDQAQEQIGKGRTLDGVRLLQQASAGFTELIKEKPSLASILQPRIVAVQQSVAATAVRHFQNYFSGQLAQLDNHLASGQLVPALALEATLRRHFVQMENEFPGSAGQFGNLSERIQFLEGHKDRAAGLQRYLRQQFVAIPGHAGWWMLRTEVSQDLYIAIMDIPNPSRNKGGTFPVESVSHIDASNFATRVGWLLGVRTQLPSMSLFNAVAGKPESPAQISIQPATSTVPVDQGAANAGGFLHLWGNVAEWLAPAEKADVVEVTHAGGHFLDTAVVLFAQPISPAAVNDRSRLIGFRLVIHIP
jgi:tetratricopeptide (TPR) repeat protein